ncbi:MAG TPA: hypothetical protein VMT44_04340 [Methanoregula sp.]|nr:hypothetical protein [Methanoregula sp.]
MDEKVHHLLFAVGFVIVFGGLQSLLMLPISWWVFCAIVGIVLVYFFGAAILQLIRKSVTGTRD